MTTVIISNRGRPRDEIKAAIYDAAIATFRKQGFALSTVDAIVAAAGVAKGTFFNFFPTKLDVLRAYYRTMDVEVARCRAALDPAAPLQSLHRYAQAVELILIREGSLGLELFELTLNEPAMRRMDEGSGAVDADEFAAFLSDARTHGVVARHVDPVAAAHALVDLWSGAVRMWLRNPGKESLVELFDVRIAMLFRGLECER